IWLHPLTIPRAAGRGCLRGVCRRSHPGRATPLAGAVAAMTTATIPLTFSIGGDLPVHRLGYGAMQLPGPGVWGEPADRAAAVRVVQAAVEQGVDFIDTADSYGPLV